MKKKVLIFDFDGVLADSFNTFYSLWRDAMRSVGISLTPDQYRDFYIGNIHQELKDFIQNSKKHKLAMEFRNSNFDKYYRNKSRRAKLFPGTKNFLKEINKNYILTITSSGRKNNIEDLLKEKGSGDFFSLVLGNSSHSKERMLKKILSKYQVDPGQTFFITDTIGDLKVAKKLRLKTIAVTWGFHNKKTLTTAHPDYVASDFKTIESILKSGQAN